MIKTKQVRQQPRIRMAKTHDKWSVQITKTQEKLNWELDLNPYIGVWSTDFDSNMEAAMARCVQKGMGSTS